MIRVKCLEVVLWKWQVEGTMCPFFLSDARGTPLSGRGCWQEKNYCQQDLPTWGLAAGTCLQSLLLVWPSIQRKTFKSQEGWVQYWFAHRSSNWKATRGGLVWWICFLFKLFSSKLLKFIMFLFLYNTELMPSLQGEWEQSRTWEVSWPFRTWAGG